MNAVTATLPGANKKTAAENKSGVPLKIARLAKLPVDVYYDCRNAVTGVEMLVEEASERATKPWYQRLPED